MKHARLNWKTVLFVLVLAILCLVAGSPAYAGGPSWVAGSSYFTPSAKGKPVVWSKGLVPYYLDQGNLSPTVSQSQARAMIANAAAVWNAVPAAAVAIPYNGSLAEDVNGTNMTVRVNGVINMPADIKPTATKPLAIVFDADGSVIDAFFGAGASSAASCQENGVIAMVDNFST